MNTNQNKIPTGNNEGEGITLRGLIKFVAVQAAIIGLFKLILMLNGCTNQPSPTPSMPVGVIGVDDRTVLWDKDGEPLVELKGSTYTIQVGFRSDGTVVWRGVKRSTS